MFESYLKPPVTFPTLTGSIVTFNSQYALPLKSHTVDIDSVSGVSAINIANISDNANINFFKGVLNGTYGFVDMGTLNWNINTNYKYSFFTAVCDGIVIDPVEGKIVTVAASKYTPFGATYFSLYGNNDHNLTISKIKGSNSRRLMIQDSDYSDPNVFKNSLSGNYVIYELENVGSFNFTDVQFNALCNAFGVIGNMFTIQIGQTVNEATYNARTGVLEVTQPTVQTLQLPPCPIDTIANSVNNIWADTGDTTLQYIKFG